MLELLNSYISTIFGANSLTLLFELKDKGHRIHSIMCYTLTLLNTNMQCLPSLFNLCHDLSLVK